MALIPRPASLRLRTSIGRGLTAVRDWLPRGNMLRPAAWARRHRRITRFALVQSICLAGYGLLIGRPVADAVAGMVVAGVPALLGMMPSLPRLMRTLSAVVSLMFASAALVELTEGLTEAHFHFFVMLGVVSLYQDWAAFGMCVLITVLHHAVMGLTTPQLVFGGSAQRDDPIKWALIHGGFIVAASVTHMIAWRATEQQELRDPLTQLPNRSSFVDRLRARLEESAEPVAVLFVDIDNFKTINDSGGHHVGDAALSHAAARMTACLRDDDVVARIGGDEFAVLFPGTAAEATEAGQRLVQSLQAPVVVEGRELFVTASVGVADSVLARSREAEDLLRDADLAMYLAKSSGKNRVVTYTAGVDTAVRERADLAQDLRQALELDQLRVHYQPVVRAPDGTVCGVEALLRWEHPVKGMIPPVQFIPLAEETGTIKEIGAWVLRTAAEQVASWQRGLPGFESLELAVNLSPVQLRDPVLLRTISSALHESGLAPGSLMVEVTESMLLADLDLARRQLDAVRAMGAHVAIDDFGTGYSSLSYLARLPADQVKIDRSFVQELAAASTSSIALVRSIVDMARALDLDVQAEGVEEVGQQEILNQIGCPRSQGFLFSRPLTADAFEEFATAALVGAPTPADPATV